MNAEVASKFFAVIYSYREEQFCFQKFSKDFLCRVIQTLKGKIKAPVLKTAFK